MTPTLVDLLTILGGSIVVAGLAAGMAALWHLVNDWREDRRREAEYARRWVESHRVQQDRGRYVTDRPEQPE